MPTSKNRRKQTAKKTAPRSPRLPAYLQAFFEMGQLTTKIVMLDEGDEDNGRSLAILRNDLRALAAPHLGRGVWQERCGQAVEAGALGPYLAQALTTELRRGVELTFTDLDPKDEYSHSALMALAVIGPLAEIEKLTADEVLPVLREVWGSELDVRMTPRFIHPALMGVAGLDGLIAIKDELLKGGSSTLIDELIEQSPTVPDADQRAGVATIVMGLFPFVITHTLPYIDGDQASEEAAEAPFWRAYNAEEADQERLLDRFKERFPHLLWTPPDEFTCAVEGAIAGFIEFQGNLMAVTHGITDAPGEVEIAEAEVVEHNLRLDFVCRGQAVGQGQVDIFTFNLASPEWVNDFMNGAEEENEEDAVETPPPISPARLH